MLRDSCGFRLSQGQKLWGLSDGVLHQQERCSSATGVGKPLRYKRSYKERIPFICATKLMASPLSPVLGIVPSREESRETFSCFCLSDQGSQQWGAGTGRPPWERPGQRDRHQVGAPRHSRAETGQGQGSVSSTTRTRDTPDSRAESSSHTPSCSCTP